MAKWSRNNCVLIGDACHGVSLSLGQGVNVGLEDSVELGALLRPLLNHCDFECNEDKPSQEFIQTKHVQTILEEFEQLRIGRVKKIHDMSRHRRNGNKLDASFRSWVYNWKPSFMIWKEY